ncbi:MAG TPA: thiamine phosphate synthase [Flavobacterium sp.]|nr:thiamine phosphate synthase [Flavobacterium sp.]
MFSKLQYISQGENIYKQTRNIQHALDQGCDWIQLRFKTDNEKQLLDLAEAVKLLCDTYSATFIINDNPYLCQQVDADGVHLGLTDMNVKEARNILDEYKIIGGTANTYEDILLRFEENCDYIGLGPYKFTTTKQNLSPLLGLEGYQNILQKLKEENIHIPIYAIGGIQIQDVENLMKTGIHGIAVSSMITNQIQKKHYSQLNTALYVNS